MAFRWRALGGIRSEMWHRNLPFSSNRLLRVTRSHQSLSGGSRSLSSKASSNSPRAATKPGKTEHDVISSSRQHHSHEDDLKKRISHYHYGDRPNDRMTIQEFTKRYADAIGPGERKPETPSITLCGRIISPIRELSSKLRFFHVESEGARIQVLADSTAYGDGGKFVDDHSFLKRGDIVEVRGYPGKSKKGELSLVTTATALLTPCIKDIPMGRGDGKDAVSDVGFLHKHREVSLLVGGAEARLVFEQRAKAISTIRRYLDNIGFLEVETPILWPSSGGAFAKPFQTTTRNLTLRIAPELSLKRLVIGGYDRVYEIGKVFRDEGLSPRHNPEFTSIELYQAYANAEDLERMTKNLLREVFDGVKSVSGNGTSSSPKRLSPANINFDADFPRISVADELEKFGKFRFDDPSSITPENLVPLLSHKTRASMSPADLRSVPRLVDKLIGQEVESKLDPLIPTFVVDHPVVISPLAKEKSNRKGVVERFELFAGTFELCNAYSELNDPKEQRVRFTEQAKWRASGDEECQLPDESFCEALEYGLPPTAGWGMGIDRLLMILLGKHSIRDVVLFPQSSASF